MFDDLRFRLNPEDKQSETMSKHPKVVSISIIIAAIGFIVTWYFAQEKFDTNININLTKDKVLLNFLILFFFTVVYATLMYTMPGWWNWPESQSGRDFHITEACANGAYFGMITHSTIGFGDISPNHHVTRAIVLMHAAIVVLINFAGGVES